MSDNPFLPRLVTILNDVATTQDAALEQAATKMAEALEKKHLVHLYGSGHSHMPTLDAFPRYGGFIGLHPLNDPRLMWHNVLGPGGVKELLWLERTEGYVEQFLGHEPLRSGDVLIVFSHGGRNAAPVEVARYGRDHGLFVISVTSKANLERPAEHSSGKRMADFSDVVIDTHVPIEDALVTVEGWSRPVAGASTIVAMAIMQELVARTAQQLAKRGVTLPTFVSPTVPGASLKSNDEVFDAHRGLLAEAERATLSER
jgi:uncharacterized phosphosugar-binding protein